MSHSTKSYQGETRMFWKEELQKHIVCFVRVLERVCVCVCGGGGCCTCRWSRKRLRITGARVCFLQVHMCVVVARVTGLARTCAPGNFRQKWFPSEFGEPSIFSSSTRVCSVNSRASWYFLSDLRIEKGRKVPERWRRCVPK